MTHPGGPVTADGLQVGHRICQNEVTAMTRTRLFVLLLFAILSTGSTCVLDDAGDRWANTRPPFLPSSVSPDARDDPRNRDIVLGKTSVPSQQGNR